jgi:hypothetical protein
MRFITILSLLSCLVAAAPAPLEDRATAIGPQTSNDYGVKCWPILFVFARGTTEPGNLVSSAT